MPKLNKSQLGEINQPEELDQKLLQLYQQLEFTIHPTRGLRNKIPRTNNWRNAAPVYHPARYAKAEIFYNTGERYDVIDLDGGPEDANILALAKQLGYPIAQTASRGHHIYVKAGTIPNRSIKNKKIDLKSTGGGVILPSGRSDRIWLEGHSLEDHEIRSAEPFLELLGQTTEDTNRPSSGDPNNDLRSLLAEDNPDGRNNHLASIGGMLTKRFQDSEDDWKALVGAINRSLSNPLETEELENTVFKLWARDQTKPTNPTYADPDLPVIHQDGRVIYRNTVQGKVVDRVWIDPTPDITTLTHVGSTQEYTVKSRFNGTEVKISARDFYGPKAIQKLNGVGIKVNNKATNGEWEHSQSLLKYFEKEVKNSIIECEYWGWNDEHQAFVGIDEGFKGPDGIKVKFGRKRNNRAIESCATWQTDEESGMLCAMAALQALKGIVTMHFEFSMGVSGAAGSGKSSGLPAIVTALTGSPRMDSFTEAVAKQRSSQYRNGLLFADDMDSISNMNEGMGQILRQSASNSIRTKMGINRQGDWDSVEQPLLSNFLFAAEDLGKLQMDAALADRTPIIELSSPKDRRTLDGKRYQIEEMTEFFAQLGGSDAWAYQNVSGTFIQDIRAAGATSTQPDLVGDRNKMVEKWLLFAAQSWDKAYPKTQTFMGYTIEEAVKRWFARRGDIAQWKKSWLLRVALPHAISTYPDYRLVPDYDRHKVPYGFTSGGEFRYSVRALSGLMMAQRGPKDDRSATKNSESSLRTDAKEMGRMGVGSSNADNARFNGGQVRSSYVLLPEAVRYVYEVAGEVVNPEVYPNAMDRNFQENRLEV